MELGHPLCILNNTMANFGSALLQFNFTAAFFLLVKKKLKNRSVAMEAQKKKEKQFASLNI
jgi:hypothetical protein